MITETAAVAPGKVPPPIPIADQPTRGVKSDFHRSPGNRPRVHDLRRNGSVTDFARDAWSMQ
ncbi:MAG: hypothetical protein N2C14_21385 [Planctomycetales bacterium]